MSFRGFRKNRTAGPDFKEKKTSVNGVISIIVGIVAVIVFIAATVISTNNLGNAGMLIGFLGVTSALLCISGIVLSVSGINEKDISFVTPVIGFLVNGVLFLLLLCLFFYGLA